MRPSALFFAALALAAGPALAAAEPVQIKPSLLRLNGNLEVPESRKIAGENVVLLVHGTLSHDRQETIAALQKNLKERGVASLAITLSLGIDDRQGPRACDVVHDYALAGAQREIRLWIEWLGAQRVKSVDILGFSRGGAQVAAMGPELPTVRRMVLLAPAFATAAEQAASYQKAFGHPLAPEIRGVGKGLIYAITDFSRAVGIPLIWGEATEVIQDEPKAGRIEIWRYADGRSVQFNVKHRVTAAQR